MLALSDAVALAAFPPDKYERSVVVGAGVTVALGKVPEGTGRIGGGVDLGFLAQGYRLGDNGGRDGAMRYWAVEQPAWSYGPMGHLWRVAGAWHCSFGVRFGVAWPLCVDLGGGWLPGPALTVEAAALLATRRTRVPPEVDDPAPSDLARWHTPTPTPGYIGLDFQGALELPWVQARVGTALTPHGTEARRVSVGAFTPLQFPRASDNEAGELWRDPR